MGEPHTIVRCRSSLALRFGYACFRGAACCECFDHAGGDSPIAAGKLPTLRAARISSALVGLMPCFSKTAGALPATMKATTGVAALNGFLEVVADAERGVGGYVDFFGFLSYLLHAFACHLNCESYVAWVACVDEYSRLRFFLPFLTFLVLERRRKRGFCFLF